MAQGELKVRGVSDALIALVDGLKGFPEAITSVFPQATVQTCIVHLIRNSLAFVSWKDRKATLPAITVPRPPTRRSCGSRSSRPNGQALSDNRALLGLGIRRARKMIYTTTAVEALCRSLRKIKEAWQLSQ